MRFLDFNMPRFADFLWNALYVVIFLMLVWCSISLHKTRVDLAESRQHLAEFQSRHNEIVARAATERQVAEAAARQAEFAMQKEISNVRKKANAQAADARRIADNLRRRLHESDSTVRFALRLPSSASSAGDGEVAAGDNRPLISGSLGEEDVDEAWRADVIRTELESCYRSYDAARTKINSFYTEEKN